MLRDRLHPWEMLVTKYKLELVAGTGFTVKYTEAFGNIQLCRLSKCLGESYPFLLPGGYAYICTYTIHWIYGHVHIRYP